MRYDVRSLGVVYTPAEVVAPMVELVLAPLVRGASAEALCALRVCDPALGEGAFLIEVVRVLARALQACGLAPAEARERASACVVGVDIDARAVAEARRALGSGAALIVGDALALAWERPRFDVVIGNPPYIRQEHMTRAKAALRGFASYDGVADLYVYFIELAHRIGRRYCLITPNKWLTAAYGRPLREYLARQGSVEGVVDLGALPLFADADAFPSIVWGTAGEPRRGPVRAARIASGTSVADALRAAAPHPRERWRAEPWHIDEPAARTLLDRLAARWPSLGDVLPERPARGIVTGCNRAFVIDRATRDRLLADEPAAAPLIRRFVKGRDLRRWLPDQSQRWLLVIDRGTSLADLPAVRAHLAQFRDALEPRPPGVTGPWRGRKPGSYRWYELQDPVGALAAARTPRLFYQDIQTEAACCVDDSGELVPDTTVWILPTGDRYLLAVLNSRLYRWYARRRFPPALNGAVRPKLEYMRMLPIATPSPDARAHVVALVEQRLRGAPVDAAIDDAIVEIYRLTARERVLLRS